MRFFSGAAFAGARRGPASFRPSPAFALACAGACAARREHQPRVIVHRAVEGRNAAVADDPQPIGAGIEQIAVVRDENDRALDNR